MCIHPWGLTLLSRRKSGEPGVPHGACFAFLFTSDTQLRYPGLASGDAAAELYQVRIRRNRAVSPRAHGGRSVLTQTLAARQLVKRGEPDLVSEPLFSLKRARFVDLKGTLQTTLFLIGISRGYEPGEHVVKRELGHVFTWFHFILFLSRCSTLFHLLQKCLRQLDRRFLHVRNLKKLKVFEGLKHHLVFSQDEA